MSNRLPWVVLILAMVVLREADSCNEALCAPVVSKCMITQSCKCELTMNSNNECTCCKDCFTCLGDKYMDCCSCIGICPKRNLTTDLSKQSNVEDFTDDYTGLFKLFTETEDELMRWVVYNYPVEIDTSSFIPKIEKDIKYQTIDNTDREVDNTKDKVVILNCTVAYQRQCMSFAKCRDSCYTMGASSVRWFHDGCCECVGESCINYGINESRCPNCPARKGDANDEDKESVMGRGESREDLVDYEEVTDQKNEHFEDADDEEESQKD